LSNKGLGIVMMDWIASQLNSHPLQQTYESMNHKESYSENCEQAQTS